MGKADVQAVSVETREVGGFSLIGRTGPLGKWHLVDLVGQATPAPYLRAFCAIGLRVRRPRGCGFASQITFGSPTCKLCLGALNGTWATSRTEWKKRRRKVEPLY